MCACVYTYIYAYIYIPLISYTCFAVAFVFCSFPGRFEVSNDPALHAFLKARAGGLHVAGFVHVATLGGWQVSLSLSLSLSLCDPVARAVK